MGASLSCCYVVDYATARLVRPAGSDQVASYVWLVCLFLCCIARAGVVLVGQGFSGLGNGVRCFYPTLRVGWNGMFPCFVCHGADIEPEGNARAGQTMEDASSLGLSCGCTGCGALLAAQGRKE